MSTTTPAAPLDTRIGESIRRQLRQLDRRVRSILYLTGISRTVCLVLAGALSLGWLDWLFHFDDPGLRWLAWLALTGATAWSVWRWLWSPLVERRSPSALAALLEHRRPYIGSQLVSAAEFLDEGLDPRLGSPALQRIVVEQAERRLASIDVNAALNRRTLRRHALLAAAICGLALLVLVLFPAESATALTRLAMPWRNTPWPRRVQLQLVEHTLAPWNDSGEPLRVVRGDTLELYARNRVGALPEEVLLEYRIGEDRLIREPMRKTILRDEQGRPIDVAGVNLPATKGPIYLRAIGGDDDLMPFFQVDIVSPPELTSLTVQLDPPAYSKRPPVTLPAGSGDVQGLWGTRVTWNGAASQPLAEGDIAFQGGGRLPVALSDDGTGFSADFLLTDPKITGYRFDLKNRDGFRSGEHGTAYQLRVIPDQTPQVTLEEPGGNITATPDAVLPIRVAVKDDLGLVSISLMHQREGDAEFQERSLQTFADLPTDVQLTDGWPLEPLKLSPGDRLQFHIAAADAFDLGPPHVGQSTSRIVTIVGEEEKRDELTERLAELLADLSEGTSVQRRVAEQTAELKERLDAAGRVRAEDADLLRKLDLLQQRVVHQLLEPGDSIRAKTERLLGEFEANHLSGDETSHRLDGLKDALNDLGRETLPELQRRLTVVQKEAADSVDRPPGDLKDELADLQEQQQTAVRTLESLEAELSGWRDRRHVAQQLSELIDAQRGINRQTRDAAEELLRRGDDEWTPQEKGEVSRLSQKQRGEADAVEQFRKQLTETAQSLEARDPEASRQMNEMARELERSGISGRLRDAAASLSSGRLGQATQQQQEGLEQLESLEDLLANRPPNDEEMLVKQMKSLESELETLHKAQQELAERLQSAANEPQSDERTERLEQLTRRQQELSNELSDIERQLERLQLKRPRAAVRRAAERMERLSDSLQDPRALEERLEETLDDLEQARRELAEERRRAEEELAFEQLLKLKDELQAIAERQQSVQAEVERLDGQRAARGALSRGQLRTLVQTAQTERELAGTVARLAERVSSAEVVALALRRLADAMGVVAGMLEQKETGEVAQRDLDRIEEQLHRLLTALSPDEEQKSKRPPDGQPQEAQPDQPSGPPGDVITLIAQLELLKGLQIDCGLRTQELERRRDAAGTLPADQASELDGVRRDQAELTDLARNLLTRLLQAPDAGPRESKTDVPDQKGADAQRDPVN